MDILFVLKLVAFLLTFGLAVFGWLKLKDKILRVFLILMLILVFLSVVFFFPLGMHEYLEEWYKHIPFYLSQIFFYLFLRRIVKLNFSFNSKKVNKNIVERFDEAIKQNILPCLSLSSVSRSSVWQQPLSSVWFKFLTQEGLQHILTLPVLFLIIAIVRIEYFYIESHTLKKILNFFMFAAGMFVMIHISEFLVESQKLLPIIDPEGEFIEMIEFFWFYLGLLFFSFGIRKLVKLQSNV